MSEHGRVDEPTEGGGSRPSRRWVRTLAMQVLYQIDLTGETDHQCLVKQLTERAASDAPDDTSAGSGEPEASGADQQAAEAAVALALGAWDHRERADGWVAELAPGWPTHRQPPVDRSLLRLACHEMCIGHAPPRVAINEAVELAKRYSSEQSPAFINGVLDQLAKRLEQHQQLPSPPSDDRGKSHDGDQPTGGVGPVTGDDWLDDALRDDE